MLHLASQSPRRRELLARLGLDFGVLDLDIPEHRQPGEPAEEYVRRVAREKAGAGLLQVMAVPDAVVLGADTEVILDDEVFGKPRDAADAAAMLRRLSGRTHQVVIGGVAGQRRARSAGGVGLRSDVRRRWTKPTIAAYVASGEADGQGRRLRASRARRSASSATCPAAIRG